MTKRAILFKSGIQRLKLAIKNPLNELVGPARDKEFPELQDKHLTNLKTVANRDSFLECLPKNCVVGEVGVADGDFSKRIVAITQPSKLHLIDLWGSKRYSDDNLGRVKAAVAAGLESGQVEINRGMSVDVLVGFDDHYFDWIYLDANHTYEAVRAELEIVKDKVKPGGIIAGHDYVTGAWNELRRYGVVEAVNEFCVLNDWEMILLTSENDRHLSFAIRKI